MTGRTRHCEDPALDAGDEAISPMPRKQRLLHPSVAGLVMTITALLDANHLFLPIPNKSAPEIVLLKKEAFQNKNYPS
jgi:hypothetical protein